MKHRMFWEQYAWTGSPSNAVLKQQLRLAETTMEKNERLSSESKICVTLRDKSNGRNLKITVNPNVRLKTLMALYASKLEIPEQIYRISFNCDIIFLSSAGDTLLNELGIKDNDALLLQVIQAPSVSPTPKKEQAPMQTKPQKKKGGKKQARSNKKKSKKTNVKSSKSSNPDPVITEEDYKKEHSKKLSFVFDEVRNTLRQIRKELNDAALQKSAPKVKKSSTPKKKQTTEEPAVFLPAAVETGKAGKTMLPILVGEPSSLYKPFNPLKIQTETIDLHGCTQDEAIAKLDKSLPIWVYAAMRGEYPFLIGVDVITGAGGQVLAECVEDWIRSAQQVANRPKGR